MGLTVNRVIFSKIAIMEGQYSDTELKRVAYAIKEELNLTPFLTISRWVKHRDMPVEQYTTVDIDELFNLVLSDPNTKVKKTFERI